MNDDLALGDLIKYASPNLNKFKKSIVTNLVCELRFPTMLEFGDSVPPATLVKKLKKRYPQLERLSEVSFGGDFANEKPVNSHVMRSLRGSWAISVKQSSISVESASYSGYADLRERVGEVVEAARDVVDTDFWTRIGLRYINTLAEGVDDSFVSWINPELIGPILSDSLVVIQEFQSRMNCVSSDQRAGFLLQHGIKRQLPQKPTYAIDIDAYCNEVTLKETVRVLDQLHGLAFNVFDWSLADKSRKMLLGQ